MGRGGSRVGSGRKPNRPVGTVQLKMGLGTCPKDLSPAAKKAWRKWAPIVEKLLPICEADRSVFTHFCQAQALYDAAIRDVEESGSVLRLKTRDGGETVRQNPSVKHVLEFGRCLDGLRQQLGLGPVARARLKIQVEEEIGEQPPNRVQDFLKWQQRRKDAAFDAL